MSLRKVRLCTRSATAWPRLVELKWNYQNLLLRWAEVRNSKHGQGLGILDNAGSHEPSITDRTDLNSAWWTMQTVMNRALQIGQT